MSDWKTIKAADIKVGDKVKLQTGDEFEVARIDAPFLGRDNMAAFIEDTPSRWHSYPMPLEMDVEVLPAGS